MVQGGHKERSGHHAASDRQQAGHGDSAGTLLSLYQDQTLGLVVNTVRKVTAKVWD